jgi:hypothetical protein
MGNESESALQELIGEVSAVLLPAGYRKADRTFCLFAQGNCGIIAFQKSVANSEHITKFTVNVGVVCGRLSTGLLRDRLRCSLSDAHVRSRIGNLCPTPEDVWWAVSDGEEWLRTKMEVISMIRRLGMPFIQEFINTKNIIRLWKSGKSPGLTDTQRKRFLEVLEHE